jgi:D-3-phosphoglycerate dehydrogenase
MKKVYFIDVVHDVLKEELSKNGYFCEDLSRDSLNEVKSKIKDAFGLVLRSRFTLNSSFLNNAPALTFIARSGSGLENIDLDYCKKRKIEVYNSPEGNKEAVAEHCLGFLLSLLNNFKNAQQEIGNGKWLRENNRGLELENQTVGIIGYGHNGSAFAEKLVKLGVKTLVYDKYKKVLSKGLIKESNLDEIFQKSTVISFHVPLTKETMYFADYQFFNSFTNPVFVLNISRGKVVKTTALFRALQEGLLLGAGLDVLEEESSDFDLRKKKEIIQHLNGLPNVILTPHVAGWTKASYYKLSRVLADKILNKKSPQRGL